MRAPAASTAIPSYWHSCHFIPLVIGHADRKANVVLGLYRKLASDVNGVGSCNFDVGITASNLILIGCVATHDVEEISHCSNSGIFPENLSAIPIASTVRRLCHPLRVQAAILSLAYRT